MSLWACFDESGHPDDPQVMAFAIGGCITTEEHWAMFERKWKLALADEQLSWFHMVDFEHPEREGDNQFCRWNSSRRHGLLNRLLDIRMTTSPASGLLSACQRRPVEYRPLLVFALSRVRHAPRAV
jgi:hypothetical protein